jgi:cell division protein FtsA
LKNLSKIIHARVVEIIDQVFLQSENIRTWRSSQKLIAGIVLTGGGQLNTSSS